jgi:HEAT repeat protein
MDAQALVAEVLVQFRAGEEDRAFFALLHTRTGLQSALEDAFRLEKDAHVRAFLVKVLWEQRDPAVLSLLASALGDRNAEVWKEALNGLVTLASPHSLEILGDALRQPISGRAEQDKFGSWVSEAIDQIKEALRGEGQAV